MPSRTRNVRFIAAVAASASFAAGALAIFFLFTDLPFYFVDGRQIEVTGHFVDCAPTKGLYMCYTSGFRDGNGRYYLITNLQQQMADSNPDLSPTQIHTSSQYRIVGTFSYGPPANYEAADVVGGIEARSISLAK
jgi:hypothetical protein